MANDEYTSLVNLDDAQREALFNRLDQTRSMDPRSSDRRPHNRRHDKRWNYRESDIALIVEHPGGGVSRLLVCGRNLSAGGLSFLHGGFLHPGSRCRLSLRQGNGELFPLTGKITACRYIERTLHEIGLQFDKRIDPAQFIQTEPNQNASPGDSLPLAPVHGCVLYLDDTAADQNLMRFYLEGCGATVQIASNGIEGLALAEHGNFIALITDVTLPGLSGTEIAQALRQSGCKTPIIGVTADERPQTQQQALSAGCDAVLIKPLDFAQLTLLLRRLVSGSAASLQPLLSSRWSDERMRPLILTFLDDLDREIRNLRDSFSAGDADGLRKTMLLLKGSAGGYGFAQISEAAQDILRRIDNTEPLDACQAKVDDLITLCTAATMARKLSIAA